MSGEVRICPACRTARPPRRGDPLCPECTEAARQPVSPSFWLFDSPLLRDALAQLNLSAVPAIVRAATGLSTSDLAAIVGVGYSTLGCYERGHREGIFDIRMLLQFADAVDMPREVLLPLLFGGDAGTAQVPATDLGEADMDRREFGGVAAGAAAAALLPGFTPPSGVGMSHVRYLQRCVEALWSRDRAVGGTVLLRSGLRQCYRACRMLKESSYTDAVGRELLIATGRLGLCAATFAHDGGQHALAQRLYTEVQSLAVEAADQVLTAEVLEQLSGLAIYKARTSGQAAIARDGLSLAYQAAEEARYEPLPRLQALIALRHAYSAHLLGDKAAFRSGISRARRQLDRGPRSDEPVRLRFINEAEITFAEAMGYLNLGEPARGVELFRTALAGDLTPFNRAYNGATLAGSLLQMGAVSDAIDTGMSVLPALENGVTSVRIMRALRPIRSAAGSVKAKADEFCERFDAVERELNRLPQVA